MTTLFFLGATGFVGGSVLVALRASHPELAITALVRNPAHVDKVRATGVTVLQGSFKDSALVEEQTYTHDVVINIAESDDLPFIEAILRGAKKRADEGKPHTKFIYTSGVAVFVDDSNAGKFDPQGKIWNDNIEADMKDISPTKMHGDIDVPILKAGTAGYVESYIICPGAIHGTPTGPVKSGSIFYKYISQLYTKLGRVIYVGEGSNVFPFVQLDDLVDLYLRIFDLSIKPGPPSTSAYERYFIAASNAVSWKTISTAVAGALARRSILKDGVAHSVSPSDLDPGLAGYFGASQRVVADPGKASGWTPKPVVFDASVNVYIDASLDLLA